MWKADNLHPFPLSKTVMTSRNSWFWCGEKKCSWGSAYQIVHRILLVNWKLDISTCSVDHSVLLITLPCTSLHNHLSPISTCQRLGFTMPYLLRLPEPVNVRCYFNGWHQNWLLMILELEKTEWHTSGSEWTSSYL